MTAPMRRRGTRADVPVTREAIVDAAVRLIDERGPEGFSMRALAAELGVFPTTLYWHVGDRARVLGLVEQQWIEGIELPADDLGWRDWLVEVARRYRRNALRHPNVARLLTMTVARTMETLHIPDAIVGRLAELGLEGDALVHTYNALMGAVRGFVVVELSLDADDDPEARAGVELELRELDPGRYPNLVEHHDTLANRALGMRWDGEEHASMDASFDRLVTLLVAGLEAQLPRRRSR